MAAAQPSVGEALRLAPGAPVDLAALDPEATPAGPRSRARAADELAELGTELDGLQQALYAEGVGGGGRGVLLVLQGMDTSGKGGVISHVAGLVDPLGLHLASFRKPTKTELEHHFLWRIRNQVPRPGLIGVFDRSHYEDVLVVRVNELVPEAQWRGRYAEIVDFEAELAEQGVTLVKCFLHISADEQRERLLARLDDPTKRWKYNPGDLDVRARWSDYQQAYAEALQRCGTDTAPWYVVPANRKWYRNWAIAHLLRETLRDLDPRFPSPSYDVDAERARLLDADPLG